MSDHRPSGGRRVRAWTVLDKPICKHAASPRLYVPPCGFPVAVVVITVERELDGRLISADRSYPVCQRHLDRLRRGFPDERKVPGERGRARLGP